MAFEGNAPAFQSFVLSQHSSHSGMPDVAFWSVEHEEHISVVRFCSVGQRHPVGIIRILSVSGYRRGISRQAGRGGDAVPPLPESGVASVRDRRRSCVLISSMSFPVGE